LVSLFHTLCKWRNEKWEQLTFQVTQLKRKEMKKYFWIQRFVTGSALRKSLRVLTDQFPPHLFSCQMLSFHSKSNWCPYRKWSLQTHSLRQ
jgi:hypothetical protein